jgi:hypothetical protein
MITEALMTVLGILGFWFVVVGVPTLVWCWYVDRRDRRRAAARPLAEVVPLRRAKS